MYARPSSPLRFHQSDDIYPLHAAQVVGLESRQALPDV